MNLRQKREEQEDKFLSPFAAKARSSKGRRSAEPECDLRTAFQRDRDRITYSKAFRRLKHKTQVFLSPTGDHYRTRLTHTLEVSQIARTMARALSLNEDLTEAIALGHDLGHTPFGHAGEVVLNELLPGGFWHWEQSLRVVDVLERDGRGLNLTEEVRQGIVGHSKGRGPFLTGPDSGLSQEAQLVKAADVMAYIGHDMDDAIRGGVIKASDLPADLVKVLDSRLSRQIDIMVRDLVTETLNHGGQYIAMSPAVKDAMWAMRDFLYEKVYDNLEVHGDFLKASKVVRELYQALTEDDLFYQSQAGPLPEPAERKRAVVDYLAGMTDRYALKLYEEHFLPRPWGKI